MLYAQVWGTGPPVVLVHGFTQSATGWGSIGDRLASAHRLIALDAPGHGRSASVEADLPGGADLMAAATQAASKPGDPLAWVGYSMGGRFCLHVALRHPQVVSRMILVSATGGIDDGDERAMRRQGDEKLARRVEEMGVEAFVVEWLSQPLFASLPESAAGLEGRLGGTAAGLASSLRLAGTGTQEPLWPYLSSLDMPILVVAGALDAKFVDLGRRLVDCIGDNARLEVIDGAGHACHMEKPDRFLALAKPFLAGD